MLKEFSTKLRERSCGEEEYLKKIEVKDFVKYDRDNLWKTSNDVMNQYIPPIERGTNDSSTGLKTTISPIQAKHDKEAENHIYFDPLKKYAQTAEDEGNHIERNPLDNHKLKHNNYFPMSRLVWTILNLMLFMIKILIMVLHTQEKIINKLNIEILSGEIKDSLLKMDLNPLHILLLLSILNILIKVKAFVEK